LEGDVQGEERRWKRIHDGAVEPTLVGPKMKQMAAIPTITGTTRL